MSIVAGSLLRNYHLKLLRVFVQPEREPSREVQLNDPEFVFAAARAERAGGADARIAD
jgi:hypothetical protein